MKWIRMIYAEEGEKWDRPLPLDTEYFSHADIIPALMCI
jgi:hypothetical protein